MAVLPASLRGLFFAYSVGSGGGAKSGWQSSSASLAALACGCFGGLASAGDLFCRLLGGTWVAAGSWLLLSAAVLQFSFSGWSVLADTAQKPASAALPVACRPAVEQVIQASGMQVPQDFLYDKRGLHGRSQSLLHA